MDNVSGVLIRFKDQFLTFTNVPGINYRDTYYFSALLSYTFVDKDHEGMESVQGPYYHTVVCACCSIVPDGYNTVAC